VTTARRLAGARRATAVLYSCNFALCRESAQLIRRNLSRIGIDVETKEFPFDVMFERALRPREQWDILLADWGADYADPYDFLNALLDPRGNLFHFRNQHVTRLLDQAADLSGPARYDTYGELAVELARDEAPWVSYAVGTERDFFSARVGCQVYNPVYGMDLA